ncbi:hypothetical protein Golomagni_02486 [Golovinomyces magnicellulatus]|nr:hypothetical protein Golomagni_02486 [Golovinomyces magnicellulatus]
MGKGKLLKRSLSTVILNRKKLQKTRSISQKFNGSDDRLSKSNTSRPSSPILNKRKNVQTDQESQKSAVITIPFSPEEHILLVGEADMSFTRSLIEHHGCTQLTPTVYESEAELREKYPHVDKNIGIIESKLQNKIRYGFDITNSKSWACLASGKRKMKTAGTMDRIIFNFPHVGGKSKDVNRQVRFNQELLVSLFENALPCLSPSHGSSIIVTLFDGEPYTLWNIRDLARHSQLEVARSFKFNFSAYPGYRHSRTIGIIKGNNGKIGGGWKGEERSARTYVFVRKGEGQCMGTKAKRNQESDNEES